MKKFFGFGKKEQAEEKPQTPIQVLCQNDTNNAEVLCDCKGVVLCEDCLKDHVGMDHRKTPISEIGKTLGPLLNKRLTESDQFYKNYKSTESGKFFEAYVNFFEQCKEAALMLRDHYDKEDPWSKTTPHLAKFVEGFEQLKQFKTRYNNVLQKDARFQIESYRDFNEIAKKMDKSREDLFNNGGKSNKIFSIDYQKDHTKSDIKNYLNAMFLQIFRPDLDVDIPGAPNAQKKNKQQLQGYQGPEFQPLIRAPRPPKDNYFMPEQSFDEDTIFMMPELEEEFDVSEGNTFKGHVGPIRDLIKINHHEFISCDDSGQVIVWNKKDNKMKGFSLKSIGSKVIESILSLTLTDDRGRYLVCGMKHGHLLIYNRSKGGKKLIRDAVKKQADVVAVTDLENLKSKFFLVQDSRYYIRMYSADKLYYEQKDDQRVKPFLEIGQRVSQSDSEIDIYYGDNKLIELMTTEFAANKQEDVTFILSCMSSAKEVNLYVIDGVQTKVFCCYNAAPIEWQYQHLRKFSFQLQPTSLLELSHNRIAVAVGREIEIIDVHSETKGRILLEGHEERIRSLTMMSRKTKIVAKSKRLGRQEFMQNTDFLMSAGDDIEIRIWKIPPPLSTKIQRKMKDGIVDDVNDIDYCVLQMAPKHNDSIHCICYLHESIATASKDGMIKVYNLEMKIKKLDKELK